MKKLREKLKSRIDEFSSGTLMDSPLDLRDWWGVPDFKGVTMPNVASLMFMVQEGDKTAAANRRLPAGLHHQRIGTDGLS